MHAGGSDRLEISSTHRDVGRVNVVDVWLSPTAKASGNSGEVVLLLVIQTERAPDSQEGIGFSI